VCSTTTCAVSVCAEVTFLFHLISIRMNKKRRSVLREINERLSSIRDEIETVMDEEQDAYDNLPDGLREADRGEQLADNVSELQGVIDTLDSDVIDKIDAIAAC